MGDDKNDIITMYHTILAEINLSADVKYHLSYSTDDINYSFLILNNPSLGDIKNVIDNENVRICIIYDNCISISTNIIDYIKSKDFNIIFISPILYEIIEGKIRAIYQSFYAYCIRLLGIPILLFYANQLFLSIGSKSSTEYYAHDGKLAIQYTKGKITIYCLYCHVDVVEKDQELIFKPILYWNPKTKIAERDIKSLSDDKLELIRMYLCSDIHDDRLISEHLYSLRAFSTIKELENLPLEDIQNGYISFIKNQLDITGLSHLVTEEFQLFKQVQ